MDQRRYDQKGFTLIEALASIFIFSIITLIVSAVFLSALNTQRRALNLQQAGENANFILETMAKELRVSTNINTPDTPNCSAVADSLSFEHPLYGTVVYSLQNGAVHRSVNGVDSVVSSNTVQFDRLVFCVAGNTRGDGQQARVTVVARVRSTNVKVPQNQLDIAKVSIDLQTTLTPRLIKD